MLWSQTQKKTFGYCNGQTYSGGHLDVNGQAKSSVYLVQQAKSDLLEVDRPNKLLLLT